MGNLREKLRAVAAKAFGKQSQLEHELVKQVAVAQERNRASAMRTRLPRSAFYLYVLGQTRGWQIGNNVTLALGTSTASVKLYSNNTARPLLARARTLTAGVGLAVIGDSQGASAGFTLNLAVDGATSSDILLLPGQDIWITPRSNPTSAVVAVDFVDVGDLDAR